MNDDVGTRTAIAFTVLVSYAALTIAALLFDARLALAVVALIVLYEVRRLVH